MKKSFFCTILMFLNMVLNAQVSHPQDTLVSRVPNYFYQFWFDSADCEPQYGYWHCNKDIEDFGDYESAKYNYTDKMLKVVGVAAMIRTKLETTSPSHLPPTTIDTTYDNWFETFSLYKPSDTGMTLLASQRYTVLDTARCVKVFYNPVDPYEHMVADTIGFKILPVFEAYFDKPVYVTDSFYVATTNYNGHLDPQTNSYPSFSARLLYYSIFHDDCFPQKRAFRLFGGDWKYSNNKSTVDFIFPIIALDTCKPVTGLTFDGQDSLQVFLSWLRGEHNDSWELAYGPAVADPDSFAVVDCNDIRCTLQGLTPGTKYAARVRGVCFNDSVYSDWSDTIQFHVAEYNPPIDIPSVTANALFTLTPNPAHDYVVLDIKDVVSDLKKCTLTVSDAAGREVLSLNIAAPHTRINTRTLPKGMYFVTLTTPQGSNTQKLVVE